MDVVGRANDDRVDLLVHLVEHLSEVSVPFGLGVLLKSLGCPAFVNVTQGDNILTGQILETEARLAAGADEGDVEAVIRRQVFTEGTTLGRYESGAGKARKLEHPATSYIKGHGKSLLEHL
jgi:hypothetical protein